MTIAAGTKLGRYEIRSKIGEGGMGEVYLAEDTKLNRKISLKFLSTSVSRDQERLRRFEQEARAASALNHPNIITIHEIGEENSHQFIATEFIEGQTLRERLSSSIDTDEALGIAIQVASALVAAHRVNIVHRDVKPENIMIRKEDGLVKVLDFGLAKMSAPQRVDPEADTQLRNTSPGVVMGTVAYMSPEQARGEIVDERTDIWSLGVVLYEMIAGCSPFAAGTSNEIISAILSKGAPPPLTRYSRIIPERLEEIVEKALAKNKDERYQTSKDLLIDLKRLQQTLQLKAVSERSSSPDRIETPNADGQATAAKSEATAASTPQPSRAEYIVNQVKSHKLGITVTLVLSMLTIVTGVFIYRWRVRETSETVQPQIKSLAILPLKALNSADRDDYLGLGITDAIITRTTQTSAVVVRPLGVVRRYEGLSTDPLDAARQMQVDSVLDSTWQRMGNKLRINLHLLRTSDGATLWAASFDREMNDMFVLEDDISLQVAKALNLALTANERQQLGAPPTRNPEAYDAYLKGKFYRTQGSASKNLSSATEMFERATVLDPNFAIAHVELASTCNLQSFTYGRDQQLEEKAYVAIERALALNPNLAEAYVARGNLWWTLGKGYGEVVKEFRHALELNPNLAAAHSALWSVYVHVGLLDRGLEEHAIAQRLSDPVSAPRDARIHWYQQKYELALSEFGKTGNEDEKALTLWHLGRTEEAAGILEERLQKQESKDFQAPDRTSADIFAAYAVVLASLGQKQKAEDYIRRAIEDGHGAPHFHHAEFSIACAFALMGNKEAAIDWLQKTAEDGLPCYPLFETEPALSNLRSDSQFIELMAKFNKQWVEYQATL